MVAVRRLQITTKNRNRVGDAVLRAVVEAYEADDDDVFVPSADRCVAF